MRDGLRTFWSIVRRAALKWRADNCVRLGASLSYYTLFSLFPLILVVLTIVRVLFVNSDTAQSVILDALGSVTGGFRDDFALALRTATETRGSSGLIGTILLIFGASWVFGELVSAFDIIWGLEAPSGGGPLQFLRSTFMSLALVLSGVFLLLVSMIISAVLASLASYIEATFPGGAIVWEIVHTLVTLTILTLVFALLLKYLPQTYVRWRDVWPGAFLTAVLWSLLQLVIARYVAFYGFNSYGAIGAVLALVVWVYLSSQILFFGGEFTVAYITRKSHAIVTPPPPPIIIVRAPTPPPRPPVISGATGVTVGVLGTIAVAVAALTFGIARIVRRMISG